MKAYLLAIPKPRLIAFIAWSLGVAIFSFSMGSLTASQAQPSPALNDEAAWGMIDPPANALDDEGERVDPPDLSANEQLAPSGSDPAEIIVSIVGAIVKPGAYKLPATARVTDLIWLAGGLEPDADLDRIKLAGYLEDSEQIKVWRLGESGEISDTLGASPKTNTSGLININSASAAELEGLPKIGPSLAQAIIKHRTENGPFTSVDDLEQISGISPATIDGFRDKITVQ
jgi:comEA protein